MRPGSAGWECKSFDDVPAFAVSKQMLERADSSALVAGRMMGAIKKVDEQDDLNAEVHHVIEHAYITEEVHSSLFWKWMGLGLGL